MLFNSINFKSALIECKTITIQVYLKFQTQPNYNNKFPQKEKMLTDGLTRTQMTPNDALRYGTCRSYVIKARNILNNMQFTSSFK